MQYVPTIILDSSLKSFLPPKFIKTYIEEGGLSSINGAQNIINNIRPIFYFEVSSNVLKSILDFFNIANYQAYHPNGVVCTSLIIYPPKFIFIPKEKTNSL